MLDISPVPRIIRTAHGCVPVELSTRRCQGGSISTYFREGISTQLSALPMPGRISRCHHGRSIRLPNLLP
jgi:hypothetical protein